MNAIDEQISEPLVTIVTSAPKTDAQKKGSIGAWIDERTSLRTATARLAAWQVPSYVQGSILFALGWVTMASLIYQILTGVSLLFYYTPNLTDAYNSVDFITYQAPLGWLVRGIHHYNASAVIILVFLHTLRTFFFTTYKRPRELTWLSGVVLLLVALAFGFTGYLLPWDQRGYWATVVSTEIAAKTPLIGDMVSRLMKGGALPGQLTLSRFFVIHVAILPSFLLLFIVVHLAQVRRHGIAPRPERGAAPGKARSTTVRFFPNGTVVPILLSLGLLALLVYLSSSSRAALTFPADPTSTDYNPQPEWYFLFLYEMLHYAPGAMEPLLIVAVPTLVFGSMILLPFLDTSPERRPWRKPLVTGIAIFYVVVIVGFTLLAL